MWRRPKEAALKLFYAADLHGSEKCFGKFLSAAKFYDVDLLVLGGDLTGKAMVPVVRVENGTYEARFLGRRAVARGEAEILEIEKQIRFNGFYPYRCEPDELSELQQDPELRATRFEEVMRRDVSRWVEMADERLRTSEVRCLAMPGNDDGEFVSDVLRQSERIENCDEQVMEVGGFQVLSLGYSNPTPWHSPRELTEEEMRARLERLAEKLDRASERSSTCMHLHTIRGWTARQRSGTTSAWSEVQPPAPSRWGATPYVTPSRRITPCFRCTDTSTSPEEWPGSMARSV